MKFKLDPKETDKAEWHEAYVTFDDKYWYAIGGGETPIAATQLINWYRKTYYDKSD